MKNVRDILIVVAVGATLFFPCESTAKLFQRFRDRKAQKQATTVQYTSPDCTITGCPIHTQPGTGKLGVNSKGGFTGRLTDEYYADHFAKKTGATTNQSEDAKDVPAKNADIDSAAAIPVAEAEAALAAAEQNLRDKQEALRLAIVAQNQADAREALELQQEIDDLTARLEALRPGKTARSP